MSTLNDLMHAFYSAAVQPEISVEADAGTNDSDKTITVPVGKRWHLKSAYASIATTGTAGNRRMVLEIKDDSDNIVGVFPAGVDAPASQTWQFTWAPDIPRDSAGIAARAGIPIPGNLFLPAGWKIRIADNNVTDAAADDLTIRAVVQEFTVTV